MPINTKRLRLDDHYRQKIKESLYKRQIHFDLDHFLDRLEQQREETVALEDLRGKIKRKEESKEKLKQKAKEMNVLEQEIQNLLHRIPNIIDRELEINDEATPTDNYHFQPIKDASIDPIFDIGGYKLFDKRALLAKKGIDLANALQEQLLRFLKLQPCTTIQVPSTLPGSGLEPKWGITSDPIEADDPSRLQMPSWMALASSIFDGQKYSDRMLPLYNILNTTGHFDSIDTRESQRKASWETKRYQWFLNMVQPQTVVLNALTGPSELDSRPVLLRTIRQLRAFYSLLVPPSVPVTIRQLPVSQLCPAESCRLVVESRMPTMDRPVCLAYLSNLTDYSTTAVHGSTSQTLHMINGTLCSVAETLAWMAIHNATQDGLDVPRILKVNGCPYIRKTTVGKTGKRVVTQLQTHSTTMIDESGPTKDQIRAEALSNPFEFLPFLT